MKARILCISDLHKRYKDSTSIKGQLEVQQLIQEDLIAFNKANNVTHNIVLGDWYDRGFHGLGQAYGSMEMDRRLSESVNGNMYLCVGNHFYLERDENPEMYIIQPNQFIKPQMSIPLPEKPIFNVVQSLNIGTVQIDFFHFNKLNKDYVAFRDQSVTFHIGIYHDDAVIPGWIREQEGLTGSANQSYMNRIYDNVDLAIHGHIHTKIGMCSIQLATNKKVPLCVPGSLGITQNKECFKHSEVQLPMIEIDDDDTVHIKMVKFSTHLDKLRFYNQKKKKKDSNLQQELLAGNAGISMVGHAIQSLPVYMNSKGYKQKHLNLINAAVTDTLSVATAVMILAEADQIEQHDECSTNDQI